MIGLVAPAPADSGLPVGPSALVLKSAARAPLTGTPIFVFHGPFPVRAALGLTPDRLVIQPTAPLVPSICLQRHEIAAIRVERSQWYAFGRAVIVIRRVKGPTLRLLVPLVEGLPDGTNDLARLLRAWWRSGHR
jgi:hypothetical protein